MVTPIGPWWAMRQAKHHPLYGQTPAIRGGGLSSPSGASASSRTRSASGHHYHHHHHHHQNNHFQSQPQDASASSGGHRQNRLQQPQHRSSGCVRFQDDRIPSSPPSTLLHLDQADVGNNHGLGRTSEDGGTRSHRVEVDPSLFLEPITPIGNHSLLALSRHADDPASPVSKFKLSCGVWASFLLATIFVFAGAKFYFYHQSSGLEILVTCSLIVLALYVLVGCTMSYCKGCSERRGARRSDQPARSSSPQQSQSPPPVTTVLDIEPTETVNNVEIAETQLMVINYGEGPPPPYHIAISFPECTTPPPSYEKAIVS